MNTTPELDLEAIDHRADEVWKISNRGKHLDLVGDVRALVAEVERLRSAYRPMSAARLRTEDVLNAAFGDEELDGAGEGLASDVQLLVDQRDEARAEAKRLRVWLRHQEALTASVQKMLPSCHCDTNPETTDGPSDDCARHGRPYSYWVERSDALDSQVAKVKALAGDSERHMIRWVDNSHLVDVSDLNAALTRDDIGWPEARLEVS